MDRFGFLASAHRRVVDEFIEVVLDDLAGDVGDVERNVLGVALRQEVETWLAPELLAIHALLFGVDGGTLAELPEWLELTSVIIGCREPHVLEQSSRFYTPHLKGQQRLGWARLSAQSRALPWPSASSNSTWNRSANAQARLVEMVVLPVPPFWLTTAMTGIPQSRCVQEFRYTKVRDYNGTGLHG